MNLIEFLKTFTKINNNFIDDFFSLYNSKDKYNFSINIDIIAKWFEIRKDNIKKTLTEFTRPSLSVSEFQINDFLSRCLKAIGPFQCNPPRTPNQ